MMVLSTKSMAHKYPCGFCKKLTRTTSLYHRGGNSLCHRCANSKNPIPATIQQHASTGRTMGYVLNKVFEAKAYWLKSDKSFKSCQVSLPQIMIGHKFKIVLVD